MTTTADGLKPYILIDTGIPDPYKTGQPIYALGELEENTGLYKMVVQGTYAQINPLVHKLNEWHRWNMNGAVS